MRTQIQTQIRSLSSLLENLREGIIQVPPFQRNFVWNRVKVKNLFDSIRKSYPIGSILLWRPQKFPLWGKNREVGSFTLPDFDASKSYVLDGCQRLSALFGCLTNPYTSGLEYDHKQHRDFFCLHFDLKDDTFIFPPGNPKPYQVPVYTLISTSEFRQYTRQILEPAVSDQEELDSYLDKADAFARMLVDYKMAVIEVDGASLHDAVNIFARINSEGTGITFDWMANALSFTNDFNFSSEVDGVIQEIGRYNFSAISRTTLSRCYQSAFDDNLYIDTAVESLAQRKDFAEKTKSMSKAIVRAVDFIFNELNVIDSRLLPYTAQLVFLSVFFMRVSTPSSAQIEDLKKWFWITTYTNYFTTLSLPGQRKAFAHFINYIEGENDSIFYFEKENLSTPPWPRTLALSAVRCAALVLFQLHHQRELTHILPSGQKLITEKIIASHESFPENMLISFSGLKSSTMPRDIYFLPECIEGNESLLSERKHILQNAERKFVEDLGIKYN